MIEEIKYRAAWSCPSNIALIKYWGKKPGQLPMNPSLSFGLQDSQTRTAVSLFSSSEPHVTFLFEGKPSSFEDRIKKYLDGLSEDFRWIQHFSLLIESENSFPHSAGIASSASAFGALALCLTDLSLQIEGEKFDETLFLKEASCLARLGSGSACRSIYPGFALWGKSKEVQFSTDRNAIPVLKDIHPTFFDLRDAVLLVDPSKKKVSSSAGHELMNKHPFMGSRILQANQNLSRLLQYLKSGDLYSFFEVVENEALSLHALMMSSSPSFLLLKPQSIAIIEKIRQFREKSGLHLGFTIDAGPNIHLLYFNRDISQVHSFIQTDLLSLLENKQWLDDRIGDGPVKIE